MPIHTIIRPQLAICKEYLLCYRYYRWGATVPEAAAVEYVAKLAAVANAALGAAHGGEFARCVATADFLSGTSVHRIGRGKISFSLGCATWHDR